MRWLTSWLNTAGKSISRSCKRPTIDETEPPAAPQVEFTTRSARRVPVLIRFAGQAVQFDSSPEKTDSATEARHCAWLVRQFRIYHAGRDRSAFMGSKTNVDFCAPSCFYSRRRRFTRQLYEKRLSPVLKQSSCLTNRCEDQLIGEWLRR